MRVSRVLAILLLIGSARVANAGVVGAPCPNPENESWETSTLPQALDLKKIASHTAFLDRNGVGSMDGLFLFHVTGEDHRNRLHLRPHRVGSALDHPAALLRVKGLLKRIRKHDVLPSSSLKQLSTEERLLLLSLLANENSEMLSLIRKRMGFQESPGADAVLFRDPKTGLRYAQKGQVILELGKISGKRARDTVRRLLNRESSDAPLSIWNPRTELWLAARTSGKNVPQAARVQVGLGDQDKTVLAGFEKTRAFHTEFPGGAALDGDFGARETIRAWAHEEELRERAIAAGSVRYDAKPAQDLGYRYQSKPWNSHDDPDSGIVSRSDLTREEAKAILEKAAQPYLSDFQDRLNSNLQDTSDFMRDFMERTRRPSPNHPVDAANAAEPGPSPSNIPSPDPSNHPSESQQTMRFRGGGVVYEQNAGGQTDRNFRTTGTMDVIHRKATIATCMTDYYTGGSDMLKYCYENTREGGFGAQKVRFESSSHRGKDDIDLQFGVAGELRSGQTRDDVYPGQYGQGASLGVNASRKAEIPGISDSVRLYSRVLIDLQPMSSSRRAEIGGRHCDPTGTCTELAFRHQNDSGTSDGQVPGQSERSLMLTYTRPF